MATPPGMAVRVLRNLLLLQRLVVWRIVSSLPYWAVTFVLTNIFYWSFAAAEGTFFAIPAHVSIAAISYPAAVFAMGLLLPNFVERFWKDREGFRFFLLSVIAVSGGCLVWLLALGYAAMLQYVTRGLQLEWPGYIVFTFFPVAGWLVGQVYQKFVGQLRKIATLTVLSFVLFIFNIFIIMVSPRIVLWFFSLVTFLRIQNYTYAGVQIWRLSKQGTEKMRVLNEALQKRRRTKGSSQAASSRQSLTMFSQSERGNLVPLVPPKEEGEDPREGNANRSTLRVSTGPPSDSRTLPGQVDLESGEGEGEGGRLEGQRKSKRDGIGEESVQQHTQRGELEPEERVYPLEDVKAHFSSVRFADDEDFVPGENVGEKRVQTAESREEEGEKDPEEGEDLEALDPLEDIRVHFSGVQFEDEGEKEAQSRRAEARSAERERRGQQPDRLPSGAFRASVVSRRSIASHLSQASRLSKERLSALAEALEGALIPSSKKSISFARSQTSKRSEKLLLTLAPEAAPFINDIFKGAFEPDSSEQIVLTMARMTVRVIMDTLAPLLVILTVTFVRSEACVTRHFYTSLLELTDDEYANIGYAVLISVGCSLTAYTLVLSLVIKWMPLKLSHVLWHLIVEKETFWEILGGVLVFPAFTLAFMIPHNRMAFFQV
uniref:Transmembrane protein n=1 Tax=Chromera velia CCMP2878 TaxID=1169474 RepID=A0A0G4GSX2_9ALVE|eukprot:Cvel_23257.t1-p1 / transcript=Cvel_23257.t1 / gene=Cvel_23257 / organism=Chromera_velia_CCMP2878 / gene_product=hypothetical protein / transcript_product=hypothetical protein / location=Cvel_scaffold2377:11263-15067(-) / protein_length=658 / sequence_SO=supercontig / SO=protein_coding / is_pseudo=false